MVAFRLATEGEDVPVRRVPSNATSAALENTPLLVPPEAIPKGVPRVSADIYEVPVVAVRVPTLRVGNVVEPRAASTMKELADEMVFPDAA